MAAAVNVELNQDTVDVYIEHLSGIEDELLPKAIDALIARWTEPSKIPPVGEILNEANQLRLVQGLKASTVAHQRLQSRYDRIYRQSQIEGIRWISHLSHEDIGKLETRARDYEDAR